MAIQVNELTDYMEDYLEEIKINDLTTQTIKNYQFAITAFINYIKNEKPDLQEIDKTNIKRIIKDYKKYQKNVLKNKNSSINNYLIRIVAFLNNSDVKMALGFDEKEHIRVELISEKKVLNTKISDKIDEATNNEYEEDVKSLEQWEIQEILSTINPIYHIRDKALIQFMARTGLRVSEVVSLNKTNINAEIDEKGLFIISDTNEAIDVCLDPSMVKGKSKSRVTYIDKATLRLLNDMIYNRITKTRPQADGGYKTVIQRKKAKIEKNNNILFTTNQQKRLKKEGIYEIIKRTCRRADQKIMKETGRNPNYTMRVSPHTLRHTFMSYIVNDAKIPIPVAMQLAGHSQIQTTQRYVKSSHEKTKKTYQKIQWE